MTTKFVDTMKFINWKVLVLLSLVAVSVITGVIYVQNTDYKRFTGYSEELVEIQNIDDLNTNTKRIQSLLVDVVEFEATNDVVNYNTTVGKIVGIVKSIRKYHEQNTPEYAVEFDGYFEDLSEFLIFQMKNLNKGNTDIAPISSRIFFLNSLDTNSYVSVIPKLQDSLSNSGWETDNGKYPVLIFGKNVEDMGLKDVFKSILSNIYLELKFNNGSGYLFLVGETLTNEINSIPENNWEFYIQPEDYYPIHTWNAQIPEYRSTYIVVPFIELENSQIEIDTGASTPYVLKYSSDIIDSADFLNKYYSNEN